MRCQHMILLMVSLFWGRGGSAGLLQWTEMTICIGSLGVARGECQKSFGHESRQQR